MMTKILEDIEVSRVIAQSNLDAAKSAAQRNELGQFSTPLPLAQEIVEEIKKIWPEGQGRVRFLDPALGTGVFYSALRAIFPVSQIQSACGIEIDPEFARIAENLWQSAGLQVIQADFTALPFPIENKPNLIIANPPYVRHHHLTKEAKKVLQLKVRTAVNLKLNGLAGLYCYFLLIAHRWLAEGGLGAWLVPSEFMDVNYGDMIKHYLVSNVSLLRVHRFDPQEVQFEDALVSSAVLIFLRKKPDDGHETIFTLGGTLQNPRVTKLIPQIQLTRIAKWTSLPGNPPEYVSRSRNKIDSSVTIGDLFTIHRGIATGANEFFILERAVALDQGLPINFLRPILPSPRYLIEDKILTDEEGYPLVKPCLVLLDCDLNEDQLKEFPALLAYLEAGKAQGYADRYITRHRSPWFKQESRPAAPILCAYMSRGKSGRAIFRFFRNYSQATAANVYLMLYPKAELQRAGEQNPGLLDELFTLLKQAKEEHLLHEGRTYGGGLNKIEPRELERVPLPEHPVLHTLNLKPKQLLLLER